MQKLRCFVIFLFLDLKITVFVFPVFRDYLLGSIEQIMLGLYLGLLSLFNEFLVSKSCKMIHCGEVDSFME